MFTTILWLTMLPVFSEGMKHRRLVLHSNADIATALQALQAQFANMSQELNTIKQQQQDDHRKIAQFTTGGKVAFCVRLDHALTHIGIGQVIKFKTVILNEGSGYDPATGHFTAPSAGVYQFSYFIGHNTDPPSQTWVRLMVKGNAVNSAVADSFHNGEDLQGGNVGVVRLNTGDKAWIESWHQSDAVYNAGYQFTTFSGVLIYE